MSTTSGRSEAGIAANQPPTARACFSPRVLSGTSTSRSEMSMRASPARSASSRATLPALSPWRTIQIRSGQRCDIVHLR
ncbi:MAG: hypothetical protein PGN34_15185 [Methylobacterium frigidaeris]